MPCDTIQTTACDMKHANIPILMEALKRLGLKPVLAADQKSVKWRGGQWADGKISHQAGYGASVTAESIRYTYAKEVVGFAAKQFGWKLTEKETTKRGVVATFEAKKR